MNNNSFFVTTPIYYVNDSPHIGHAYTSIACDVIARFNRLNDKKTMFLTGTDEHGLKIQRAAEKKGMNPKDFCDQITQTFKNLSKTLNLSNSDFIRTTEERHSKSVVNLWNIHHDLDICLQALRFSVEPFRKAFGSSRTLPIHLMRLHDEV